MKDKGFAVSPGTHTLVGVKQYKVYKLISKFNKLRCIYQYECFWSNDRDSAYLTEVLEDINI